MKAVFSLWLDDNYLKGPIPVELGHLKELTSIRLAGNSLSDNLPSAIAALPNLKELTLANNHLTGSLPLERILMKIPNLSLHGNYGLCSLSGMLDLPVCDSVSSPPTMISLQAGVYFKSMETQAAAMFGGDPSVPTLTPTAAAARKPRKPKLAAIIGAVVCAALIVAIVVAIVYMCLIHAKRLARRRSGTGSSEPSPQVEWAREEGSPGAEVLSLCEAQGLRQFTLANLESATSNFSQSNFIGEGVFGLVYKGLLEDGSIVAIKQRLQDPSQHFIQQVAQIGLIKHRHIVNLIDDKGLPVGRLDVRQRLSIALDAARDENYMAKVADFGLSKLLVGGCSAGSSSGIDYFLDPEYTSLFHIAYLKILRQFSFRFSQSIGFSQTTDVYGFGVFLLELISGQAVNRKGSDSSLNLVEQAKVDRNLDDVCDKTLGENAMQSLQQMLDLAIRCVEASSMRPAMNDILRELEKIHHGEMNWLQTGSMGDDIGIVTLGSELFT
ncbi:hypothetical protein ACLOJK_009315 [Asimina triloba]